MFKTANPALKWNAFITDRPVSGDEVMTVQGTANKTFFLLLILALSFVFVFSRLHQPLKEVATAEGWLALKLFMMGGIGGFLIGLLTVFIKRIAVFTAPVYAVFQGAFLGGFSALAEKFHPGIAMQAFSLTFAVLFFLLCIYRTGLIKVTDNFRLGIIAATGAIGLIYLITFALNFFNVPMPYIHERGKIAIAVNLFVVGIAALNLVLDFDFIEKGAKQGVARYMEWYAAFGLVVTLVWLYMEMLRLLTKIRGSK